jgi:hypothetical protein
MASAALMRRRLDGALCTLASLPPRRLVARACLRVERRADCMERALRHVACEKAPLAHLHAAERLP